MVSTPKKVDLGVDTLIALWYNTNIKQRMENMNKLTNQPTTLRSIVTQYKHDAMAVLMQRTELSSHPDLFNKLYSYYLDHNIMPYGIAKARTGCPYTWIGEQLDHDMLDDKGNLIFQDMPWEVNS